MGVVRMKKKEEEQNGFREVEGFCEEYEGLRVVDD